MLFSRNSFIAIATSIGTLTSLTGAESAAKRPNIVIIYVDDLARGDVGAFGCPDPGTANIDRLAKQGVKMTRGYTNNAPCSPSRTALMMGMYTQRFGKFGLSRGVPIPEDKATLAETLRDAGYMTGFIGFEKWDIGAWNQGALDRGFMVGAKQPPRVQSEKGEGHSTYYLDINGSYLTETEGDYAVDFITRYSEGEKPFFLYYVPLAVHTPLHEVPKTYFDQLYPEHEGKYTPRQHLRAALHALDLQVGRILETLEKQGIAEETLVIFSSDNGGDPAVQARPAPYRGGKRGVNRSNLQWEGNYRMPTIMSFPGTLPAGETYSGMTGTMDFYATAAALAKTELPDHCEGIDLMPLLLGEKESDADRVMFWNTHGSQIARWKDWRIVKFRDEAAWRLYDVEKDPGETRDVSGEHPDVVKTIAARYDAWLDEMAEPASPVAPPEELYSHTARGRHARRPFGFGWMTVEEWETIKDDVTQWGEFHVRARLLEAKKSEK
ncbi:MAG: sulfatase [Akkermansiaceae bacterium]